MSEAFVESSCLPLKDANAQVEVCGSVWISRTNYSPSKVTERELNRFFGWGDCSEPKQRNGNPCCQLLIALLHCQTQRAAQLLSRFRDSSE
jgi:hypothetical protein